MKIANKDSIEVGEKELLDSIIAELDWEVIEQKLKEKHNIKLQEDVDFNNGDIVVHGSKIAYKLNFDVKITLSVLFDRLGDCIDISAAGSEDETGENEEFGDENEEETEALADDLPERKAENDSGSDISGMIDEINNEE
ncbi:MAG: hypothetical protein ACQEQS_11515 [Thermodesulfobacteriota bacterium]